MRICLLGLLLFLGLGQAEAAKSLRLAMSGAFQPFSTTDIHGQLSGFDADIAREVALRMKLEPELVQTDWSGIQAGLQAEKFDLICGSMAITEARLQTMHFSLPYYVSGAQVFVRKGIQSLSDLRVGVTEDSTYAHYIQKHPALFPNARILVFGSEAEIVVAMNTGKLDAFVSDRIVGGFYVKKAGDTGIRPFGDLLYEEHCGISARLDSQKLVHQVNQALLAIISDGTYAQIYEKWVGFPPDLKALMASWSEHIKQIPSLGQTRENRQKKAEFATGAQSMLPLLLEGLGLTLKLTLITAFFSLLLGALIGVMGVARNPALRALCTGYTFLIRGTPLLVQLFMSYFVLATFVNEIAGSEIMGAFSSALIALIFNTAAYNAETIRGGIESVDKGQWQAAKALGMSHQLMLKRIILPQAFRSVLPSLANNLVVLIKDTSLVGAITLVELTYAARSIVFQTGEAMTPFFLAGLLYLILITLLLMLIRQLEEKNA